MGLVANYLANVPAVLSTQSEMADLFKRKSGELLLLSCQSRDQSTENRLAFESTWPLS